MRGKNYTEWIRAGVTILIALAAFIAGGVFLDRNLPEVVTEEDTERIVPDGTYLLYHTEEFEDALADPDITAIVIPEGVHAILSSVTLQKKLVVEHGALLETGYLDIGTDGLVVVDGTLSAGNTMIRMHGDEVRLRVEADGTLLKNENTIVWYEQDENLSVAAGAYYSGSSEGQHLMLDMEDTFDSAQSVRSYADWLEAEKSGKPVRIDANLVFEQDVSFNCPVYISEGVTVSGNENCTMEINTNLFWNCGSINGSLSVAAGAFFLNDGTVSGACEYASAHSKEAGSIFLNLGTMNVTDCSRLWENAYLYNAGTIQAYDFRLLGGSFFNYGEVYADLAELTSFSISNAGRLYNYGTFTVGEKAAVKNDGWVENAGYFTIENGASFDNNVFYNRGQFECGVTSTLKEQSGIYYGNGEFRINGISSVAVWKTADISFDSDFCEVTTAEELMEALENSEVAAIVVTEPVQMEGELEITKPVFLRAELSMAEVPEQTDGKMAGSSLGKLAASGDEASAACLIKNTYMVLQQGGSLDVPALRMENSLLVADGGRLSLTDATLDLENKSALCANFGEFELSGSSISVTRKSVLCLPLEQEINAAGVSVMLEDSWMRINQTFELNQSVISLQKESYLRSDAGRVRFDGCEISVEEKSSFVTESGNIYFTNGTTLVNNGSMAVEGEPENQIVFEQASLINYGTVNIAIPGSIDEQSEVCNEGEMDIPWLLGQE